MFACLKRVGRLFHSLGPAEYLRTVTHLGINRAPRRLETSLNDVTASGVVG